MNELNQSLLGTLGLLPSIAFSILTCIGGRPDGRIWKRLIAPLTFFSLTLGLAVLTHHFNPWQLTAIPFFMIPFGYGGDTLCQKIIRRSLWSILRTLSVITFALFTGTWPLFLVQFMVSLLITLTLGILNPLEAPVEEDLINFASVMFIPFMVL